MAVDAKRTSVIQKLPKNRNILGLGRRTNGIFITIEQKKFTNCNRNYSRNVINEPYGNRLYSKPRNKYQNNYKTDITKSFVVWVAFIPFMLQSCCGIL
jgi:hypothetical protein